MVIWAWRAATSWAASLLDLCAAPLALGYAVGRIGCQLSGDGDYGIPWHGPWSMSYPHGTVPTTQQVHPTPVYETIAMGLVALLLWRWRNRFKPGILFALYLVLSGTERFLVEFIRRNNDGARPHLGAAREPRADGDRGDLDGPGPPSRQPSRPGLGRPALAVALAVLTGLRWLSGDGPGS